MYLSNYSAILTSLRIKAKNCCSKETTDQIDVIKNKGFEVLSVADKANFIMYRHFFDDIPEEKTCVSSLELAS